jgi:hypothetical protein
MLHGRAVVGLLVLVAASVACKPADNAHAVDDKVKAAAEHIEKELANVHSSRELIIEARRRNTEDCMWLAHIDGARTVVRDAALLARYTRLCNHDIQLSMLRQLAEAAEAARKADPSGEMLPDCNATELFIATDELRKAKTADAESQALEARFTAACAPSPAGSAATGSAATGSGS